MHAPPVFERGKDTDPNIFLSTRFRDHCWTLGPLTPADEIQLLRMAFPPMHPQHLAFRDRPPGWNSTDTQHLVEMRAAFCQLLQPPPGDLANNRRSLREAKKSHEETPREYAARYTHLIRAAFPDGQVSSTQSQDYLASLEDDIVRDYERQWTHVDSNAIKPPTIDDITDRLPVLYATRRPEDVASAIAKQHEREQKARHHPTLLTQRRPTDLHYALSHDTARTLPNGLITSEQQTRDARHTPALSAESIAILPAALRSHESRAAGQHTIHVATPDHTSDATSGRRSSRRGRRAAASAVNASEPAASATPVTPVVAAATRASVVPSGANATPLGAGRRQPPSSSSALSDGAPSSSHSSSRSPKKGFIPFDGNQHYGPCPHCEFKGLKAPHGWDFCPLNPGRKNSRAGKITKEELYKERCLHLIQSGQADKIPDARDRHMKADDSRPHTVSSLHLSSRAFQHLRDLFAALPYAEDRLITAIFNGKPVTALFDTGADISVVDIDRLDELGLSYSDLQPIPNCVSVQLVSAQGINIDLYGYVTGSLSLQDSRTLQNDTAAPALLLASKGLVVPVIIGHDIASHHPSMVWASSENGLRALQPREVDRPLPLSNSRHRLAVAPLLREAATNSSGGDHTSLFALISPVTRLIQPYDCLDVQLWLPATVSQQLSQASTAAVVVGDAYQSDLLLEPLVVPHTTREGPIATRFINCSDQPVHIRHGDPIARGRFCATAKALTKTLKELLPEHELRAVRVPTPSSVRHISAALTRLAVSTVGSPSIFAVPPATDAVAPTSDDQVPAVDTEMSPPLEAATPGPSPPLSYARPLRDGDLGLGSPIHSAQLGSVTISIYAATAASRSRAPETVIQRRDLSCLTAQNASVSSRPPSRARIVNLALAVTPTVASLMALSSMPPLKRICAAHGIDFGPRPSADSDAAMTDEPEVTPINAYAPDSLPSDFSSLPDVPPDLKFDINPKLTAAQQQYVESTLRRRLRAFHTEPHAPPVEAPNVEHHIHVTDPKPVKSAPYRLNGAKLDYLNHYVAKLVANGIAQPSKSAYASPVVMVPKGTGWRVCFDYRNLNAKTVKDAYPIPDGADLLERCHKADWLSLVDVKDAFYHIKIADASRPYTAFVTPNGLYECLRMPFGLTNAPATFQRYIDAALHDYLNLFAVAFFDDVLIYSAGSLETHMQHVDTVLRQLESAGLSVAAAKSKFAYDELVFIGHLIGHGELRPDPGKIKAILEAPLPTNLTELRSFLGLANYYRRFVINYARLASPLYRMTKKDVPWEWTEVETRAVAELKHALTSAPCLIAPDFKKPFILHTDASKLGLGAVLSQRDDSGCERPVAFASRQLNKAEQNYTTTDQEFLAVMFGVRAFKPYLQDHRFEIFTDHSALTWIINKPSLTPRLYRNVQELSSYDFVFKHRAGTKHANADFLSRAPLPGTAPPPEVEPSPRSNPLALARAAVAEATAEASSSSASATTTAARSPSSSATATRVALTCLMAAAKRKNRNSTNAAAPAAASAGDDTGPDTAAVSELQRELATATNPQTLAEAQASDPTLTDYFNYLNSKEIPSRMDSNEAKRFRTFAARLRLLEEYDPPLLVVLPNDEQILNSSDRQPLRERIMVPTSGKHREAIMATYHASPLAGHSGIQRTCERITRDFYWPNMWAEITRFVQHCSVCRAHRRQRKPSRPRGRMEDPEKPFDIISADFIGPLIQSEDFKYVLVIVDHFTGYGIAIPTLNQSAETVAHLLADEVVCRFGAPRILLTDRGVAFHNKMSGLLAARLGIEQRFSTAYHPESNGRVERLNSTLKTILRSVIDEADQPTLWARWLAAATFAYNTSPRAFGHARYSPYFLVFGREPTLPFAPPRSDDSNMLTSVAGSLEPQEVFAATIVERLQRAFDIVRAHLGTVRTELERRNAAGGPYRTFDVGDTVFVQNATFSSSIGSARSRTLFTGPYRVLKRIGDLNYQLQHQRKRGSKPQVFHRDRLKSGHEKGAIEAKERAEDADAAPDDLDAPSFQAPTPPELAAAAASAPASTSIPSSSEPVNIDLDVPEPAAANGAAAAASASAPASTARGRHKGRPQPYYGSHSQTLSDPYAAHIRNLSLPSRAQP